MTTPDPEVAEALERLDRALEHPVLRQPQVLFERLVAVGREKEISRFWSYVDKTPGLGPQGTCWEWTGTTMKGYGKFHINHRRYVRAHRVAFYLDRGHWPEPLCCHTCDYPQCCNPSHLYAGTNVDNMADMVARGRSLKGPLHPKSIHPETTPRGEALSFSKLSEKDIYIARVRRTAGETLVTIARDFCVNPTTISRAIRGITWPHLQQEDHA